jgi:RimJ/RimL family protein N-acetyltransferase
VADAPARRLPPALATPRLALRAIDPGADAAFVLALLNDPDFHRHIADRGVRSLADAERWWREGPQAQWARAGFGFYGVHVHGDAALLGICGLVARDGLAHPDIGFAFLPAGRGRGLALEAAEAVRDAAFASLGLPRLLAIANADNHASHRLLRALGMREEGPLALPGIEAPLRLFALDAPAT